MDPNKPADPLAYPPQEPEHAALAAFFKPMNWSGLPDPTPPAFGLPARAQ